MTKKTEDEISIATAKYLGTRPENQATYAEIIADLPNGFILLTQEDLEASPTRENEAKWEQIVRNITSHKDSPNNFINRGYFVPIKGGLKLTANGIAKFCPN